MRVTKRLRRKVRTWLHLLWLRVTRRETRKAERIFRAAKRQVKFHQDLRLDAEARRQATAQPRWLTDRERNRYRY